MFSDPQEITLNTTDYDLVKVPSGKVENVSKFSGNDGNIIMTVHQNATNTRCRREIRLTLSKVAADPISAVNKALSASVIIAFDEPKYGFSDTELVQLYMALNARISDGIRLQQLLNGEL